MSEYTATITWSRDSQDFLDRKYSRAHLWEFDGGVIVPASSSPHIVPLPMSAQENVDPEEAFVASLSSCHMLFFLDFACRAGYVVESYVDNATGILSKDTDGKLAMTQVTLNPEVVFAGSSPDDDTIGSLHHKSHEVCFIANSVKTEVIVNH